MLRLAAGVYTGCLCAGPTGGFGATRSGQRMSVQGRQRPVRSKGSSRLTGPCQCSGSADGGARPATAMVIGNVSNTLLTAAGGEAACMAERLQSVRDREFEVRPRPAATAALPSATSAKRVTAEGPRPPPVHQARPTPATLLRTTGWVRRSEGCYRILSTCSRASCRRADAGGAAADEDAGSSRGRGTGRRHHRPLP